jgi:hypothetical protein
VLKQLFFAQNGIHRARQGGAFTGPKTPVIPKKLRDNSVGRVVKFEGEADEFRTDVEQGFWVHSL